MLNPIHHYYTEIEKIIQYGGTKKETAIHTAFFNLLNSYAQQRGLIMVAEVSIKTSSGAIVTPDGTLKDSLRQDWGYWESKDEADNLEEEIEKKFSKGYPKDNILFEDSCVAILFQKGEEVLRCYISDSEALHCLLTDFFAFERPEVHNFRKAIELFKEDVPKVTETIRNIILDAEKNNKKFQTRAHNFLTLCYESINPNITYNDVREMIIQHILTEDIFNTIFDEIQFHRENNIARELEKVIATFFSGYLRRETLHGMKHYYDVINAAAASIADHHEKQKFLKVVYETFYRSYNPKAADRLGVVYTPNEIVRFMIESVDYLLHKYFDKYLEDPGVEILDPATGTGTFVCDLIDYLRKEKLEYKYRNEIHANEVAILPYYISNLNIEYTYAQKMGHYVEFENLCFVDTLDNIAGLRGAVCDVNQYGSTGDLFALTQKNSARIKSQNEKKISIIMGNPPYNANQANENDNNKNRDYRIIDRRIQLTFIKNSTAQKTKVYDMYARFYRWAFDRINENGIVAFVTNRSFIDSRTFDGFRKTIQQEFEAVYIIDTLSDVRANPKIAGTTHNIFGIQTGVAIMFLVKKKNRENEKCKIHYVALDDFWRKEQKLQYLAHNPLGKISFEIIRPDKKNNWINIAENDFESLLPLCSKEVKAGKSKEALFEMFSLGIVTGRDEWVYDNDKQILSNKVNFLIDVYNKCLDFFSGAVKTKLTDLIDYSIKWTRAVKNDLVKGKRYVFNEDNIIESLYRPFVKKNLYFNKELNEMPSRLASVFLGANVVINFLSANSSNELATLVSDKVLDLCLLKKGNGGTQCLPLYRYDKNGSRIDNITDWGLVQFVNQYNDDTITKQHIFHYVYAVLHHPAYRKKYELNLKREFPRIPFYNNFHQWAAWGEQLMNLHINYEMVEPYPLLLEYIDTNRKERKEFTQSTQGFEIDESHLCDLSENTLRLCGKNFSSCKVKLKADKEAGVIILDEQTELHGIPAIAWEYKLGARSALEWVLDQYQEKKPKDATIAEKFNTYRFADYKEQVIELLKRVCTVSVETMKIVGEMN